MLGTLWNLILVTPIFNILTAIYQLTGSLGFSIILLTIFIRTVLLPVMLPSVRGMKKQRDIQPELDKLKKKYKYDQKVLAKKQMELFKKHGINPASGCLTQIVMITVLIALYSVIRKFSDSFDIIEMNKLLYFTFLKFDTSEVVETMFLYFDLAKPDPLYIIPILAGIFQFISSKMMQPYSKVGSKAAKKTPDKKDDMAYNMQTQMLYLMPIMTVIIGVKLPAGAALYILVTTIFSIVQYYFVSGWGGLKPWLVKLSLIKKQ